MRDLLVALVLAVLSLVYRHAGEDTTPDPRSRFWLDEFGWWHLDCGRFAKASDTELSCTPCRATVPAPWRDRPMPQTPAWYGRTA